MSAFKAARALIAKVPISGEIVLSHATATKNEAGVISSIMTPRQTYDYVMRAATHFQALAKEPSDKYIVFPVDIQTFIESEKFLNRRDIIYPKIVTELMELNSGRYTEAVFTGAIGTGKTTAALLTMAYQLYLVSCLKNPHATFTPPLDPASEILFVFQSLNARVAKQNDYTRFRSMIANSLYFAEHFPFDQGLESEMIFPNRIVVRPLSGGVNAAIGSNVYSALIDEINFMQRVENSKHATDGGVFDQAMEMYNGLSRRRESRFMSNYGKMDGMVCLVSSKRYPGEFTERKAKEAARQIEKTGRTGIFIYDRRVWEVKPDGSFRPERFNLFLGDLSRKPHIMAEDEVVDARDQHLVLAVPMEFRHQFENDMLSAIRDVAGSSTFAMNPYIINPEKIAEGFGTYQSILSISETDFVTSRPSIYPNRILKPNEPRYAHVDLSVSGDSSGVAIGYVDGFTSVPRGDNTAEMMPKINFDMILRVKPPRNGEIEFESIRTLFYKLKELGMNLKWVSFDTYQSRDSMQLLRQKGFVTGSVSMDTDSTAYDVMKSAFYDGRVKAPEHDLARAEIVRLERDPLTGLIDHPPDWSKDCSDAMAGVVFGLTYRRELWVRHGVSMRDMLVKLADREAKKDAKSEIAAKAGLNRHVSYADVVGHGGPS